MSKNTKSGDLDQLLANIDKQLLLKLLDSLIDEQEIKAQTVTERAPTARSFTKE